MNTDSHYNVFRKVNINAVDWYGIRSGDFSAVEKFRDTAAHEFRLSFQQKSVISDISASFVRNARSAAPSKGGQALIDGQRASVFYTDAESNERLNAALASLEALEVRFSETKIDLVRQTDDLVATRRELVERTSLLEQVSKDLVERTADLVVTRAELVERTGRLEQVSRDLAERTADLAASTAALARAETALKARNEDREPRIEPVAK